MIRVGGVPEHFNYPFYLARDYGLYKKHNISVDFIIQKCGTGAMIRTLKQQNVDIIIALTEGLIQEMAMLIMKNLTIMLKFLLMWE